MYASTKQIKTANANAFISSEKLMSVSLSTT